MRIAVTGANGFVGRSVCAALETRGVSVIPLVRRACGLPGEVVIGDLATLHPTAVHIPEADVLIHLAAKTADSAVVGEEGEMALHRANVDATRRMLEVSHLAGVRHFLLMSSVKVNGEETALGVPFREADGPAPQDAYGLSKWQAEESVKTFCCDHDMNWTIIRAPLIYGSTAKGNFRRLIRLAQSGLPLPLGSANNRRSLLYVENLADFLYYCVISPKARNDIFLVSDGEAISTPTLVRRIAVASNKPERIFPFPRAVLKMVAIAVGRGELYRRLFGNLEVDPARANTYLEWKPPFSLDQALHHMLSDNENY